MSVPSHLGGAALDGVDVVRLDVESIDAIAQRVAEILKAEPDQTGDKLITAADVATRFGVSRTWVYDNAEPLGVIRLGTGAKARLRFDPAQVVEFIQAKRSSREDTVRRSPPSATRWLDPVDLIPIRGQ